MCIKGVQYAEYCSFVQEVFHKVNNLDNDINDLFKLDFILYYISSEVIGKSGVNLNY